MSLPTLQFLLDLAGTFVFALSGAMAGVRRRLDLFGVLVLSFAAANSGGLIRDVIIGATPPAAIDDWRYLGVSLLAGIITFCFPAAVRQQWNPVLVFDAAGLALFAVSGAHKALEYGLNPIMATLLGMVTGIGGGMARDILLTDVPAVLRADLYAVAALLGAGIVVVAHVLQLPAGPAALVGAAGARRTSPGSGPAGQEFGLIGSTTNGGFPYAGVNLQVGPDVQVLTIGTLDGAGQAVVPVTVHEHYPIEQRRAGSTTRSPASSCRSEGSSRVRATWPSGTPGITVARTGVGAYTITHTGLMPVPGAIPTVTPIIGSPTVSSLQTTGNTTTVTFSADVTFFFTINPIRR